MTRRNIKLLTIHCAAFLTGALITFPFVVFLISPFVMDF